MAGLDIVFLGVLIFFIISGYAKGFVKTVMGFLANIIILLLTYYLTPSFSAFLQKTAVFDIIKSAVANSLKLEERIGEAISNSISSALSGARESGGGMLGLDLQNIDLQNFDLQSATQAIQGLELPTFFKEALVTNNNPVIYEALNASGFIDYIYSYITNIAINAIAAILLFLVLSILIHSAVHLLNLVAKLPVISSFNRFGGLLFGAFEGIIFVWIGVLLITLVAALPLGQATATVSTMLDESFISRLFTNTGTHVLLNLILTLSQK